MKKSFAARRVPRVIAADDDQSLSSPPPSTDAATTGSSTPSDEPPSFVKRPTNKNRKSSGLRTSFRPSQFDQDDDASTVVLPKRSNLSRVAIQRNAEKRPAEHLGFRTPTTVYLDRPSYSKDYLEELKQSTPSTPKSQSFRTSAEPSLTPGLELDVASKFGTNLSTYQLPTAIPTDAEIAEKKERRARLAKEHDFISLDDDQDESDQDDENVTRDDAGRLILKPKEKYPETRLVRDDEDMLEGFDEFTTDAKIGFGSAAEKEAAKRRKLEMAALIADAEGNSDQEADDDDSEAERNAAFELAQTRHGNYATLDNQDEDLSRPQTPPRILPMPTMDSVVDRLKKKLQEMELTRMAKQKEMQRLVDEKASIGEEEVRVQGALKETGEKYARLRDELLARKEEKVDDDANTNGNGNADGNEPEAHEQSDEADERPGLSGIGSVSRHSFAGLGSH